MASIGIDYGTSNSEVVYFDNGSPQMVKLDPHSDTPNKIRSSVFIHFPNDLPLPPAEAVSAKVNQLKEKINEQLSKAKEGYYQAKDPREQQHYDNKISELRGQFHHLPSLQQRAIQLLMKDMTVEDFSLKRLVESGEFAYGEDGFKRYLTQPDKGRLIYSPKNFLGANLIAGQQDAFVSLIAKQLSYFKQCAEQQLNKRITGAVIGRPVRFHSTRGDEGNNQALGIMQQAASEAGFDNIAFLEEPIAAAYHIESKLDSAKRVLVVDLGGGTTDICMIRLDPAKVNELNRSDDVLAVTGARLGGMECDKNLINQSIAPHMGLGSQLNSGLPVPPTYYSDMCAVDDIPRLNNFFSDDYGLDIAQTMSIAKEPNLLNRLLVIQEEKLSARLVNSSRMAKELLSSQSKISLPLRYIEEGFTVNMSTEDMERSMTSWLSRVKKLIQDCVAQSQCEPEMLFITGGMSLSPIVQKYVRGMYPNLSVVEGDAFNSVSEGLSIQAHKMG